MGREGEYLYKYRSIDDSSDDKKDWVRRIFTHNEVHFPSVRSFNDPFDCKYGHSIEASDAEMKSYFAGLVSRRYPQWNRQQKRTFIKEQIDTRRLKSPAFEQGLKELAETIATKVGVYCLTEVPNDILMWSHYADAHKGFCIQFAHDNGNYFIGSALQVTYSDAFPVVNLIRDDNHTSVDKALLTKAKQWQYEREWRIFDLEAGVGTKRYPPSILTGVIFGCRMSVEHKSEIRDWCKDRPHPVTFYQAQEADGRYALDIAKI